ncbi:hypothetical protein SAMN05444166_0171 [Singulisphaera sp. GP187]|nr:hypothetical protein SAMN05444166_0171 [Singulisphaera sp. GP187]
MATYYVVDTQLANIIDFASNPLYPLPVQVACLTTIRVRRTIWPKCELEGMAPDLHAVLRLGEMLGDIMVCGEGWPHAIAAYQVSTQDRIPCSFIT